MEDKPKCKKCKKEEVSRKGEMCRKCKDDDDSNNGSVDMSAVTTAAAAAAAGCFG